MEICRKPFKGVKTRLNMADPVSSYDAKLLKNLGGVGLVMTIIFTLSVCWLKWYHMVSPRPSIKSDFHFFFFFKFTKVVLLIAIIVKRQMLRMLLLSKRGPHSPVGSDAPRVSYSTVIFGDVGQ